MFNNHNHPITRSETAAAAAAAAIVTAAGFTPGSFVSVDACGFVTIFSKELRHGAAINGPAFQATENSGEQV